MQSKGGGATLLEGEGRRGEGGGEDECEREDGNTICHSNHTSAGLLRPRNYKGVPRSAGKCRIRHERGGGTGGSEGRREGGMGRVGGGHQKSHKRASHTKSWPTEK